MKVIIEIVDGGVAGVWAEEDGMACIIDHDKTRTVWTTIFKGIPDYIPPRPKCATCDNFLTLWSTEIFRCLQCGHEERR